VYNSAAKPDDALINTNKSTPIFPLPLVVSEVGLPGFVEVKPDDPLTGVDGGVVADLVVLEGELVDVEVVWTLESVVVVADFVADILFEIELHVSGPPSSEPGKVPLIRFQYASRKSSQLLYVVPGQASQQL
jgi:hypothetical protein